MKQEIAKVLADGTMKASVSGGIVSSLLSFLNANAAGIGVLISFIGMVIATIFYWLTYLKSTQSDKNTKEIEDLKKQLALVSDRKTDKVGKL